MKIDRNKLKKTSGVGLSPPVAGFINQLLLKKDDSTAFAKHLTTATSSWNLGKTELCHWVDVLDVCDEILEDASKLIEGKVTLKCDEAGPEPVQVIITVLQFIGLLFEHSFSRHLFNSTERLLDLLKSCSLEIVVAVLQVLYVFSKRSNYLVKIGAEQKTTLLSHLECLAENWGGKESGMSLAQCCSQDMTIPAQATQVHLDYDIIDDDKTVQPKPTNSKTIHVCVTKCKSKNAAEMLVEVVPAGENMSEKHRIALFTRLRLASNFVHRQKRLLCVMARLQAISILVYSSLMREEQENVMEGVVYAGFLDECVQVLKLDDATLSDIKTEMLKMFCSIIYLDRSPKLHMILDVMNANSYHGFLPSLVRSVIASLRHNEAASSSTRQPVASVSTPLAIALFSFLYHMAGYDNGAEALVQSGMTESLLSVIQWEDCPLELITFVTRSVRVLDFISFNDVQSFQSAGGIQMIVNRLVLEVDACRNEQPFCIKATIVRQDSTADGAEVARRDSEIQTPITETFDESCSQINEPVKGVFCAQQRSVLIKSLLNFLKKALQEQLMADGVRRMMDGALPKALKHIVSNPDYYGSPLFLNALTVTTNFIYQEPGQLTALQEKGLTDVIMQALLDREMPAVRDVVACMPSAFSALCLNERGLQAFTDKKPFEKFLKLFTSTKYLLAIKKKKGIDQRLDHMDTAMSLGNAIDELMRHQPTLKEPAMRAIVQLVKTLCEMACDPSVSCVSKTVTPSSSGKAGHMSVQASSESSDDDDDDIEAETGEDAAEVKKNNNEPIPMEVDAVAGTSKEEKQSLPLVDFILNAMKFLEAIFASVTPGEHAKKFVELGGVQHLANLLNAPNLPSDFGQSSACTSLAAVVKSVVNQSQDVAMQSLLVAQILATLKGRKEEKFDAGSKYLQYLMDYNEKTEGVPFCESGFMKELGRTQAQLMVLVQLTKLATSIQPTSSSELKKKCVTLWTNEQGTQLMTHVAKYHSEIVWEQCLLLALCSYETPVALGESYAQKQVQYMQEHSKTGQTDEEKKEKEKENKKEKSDTSSQMTPDLKALVHLVQKTGRELSDLLSLQMKLCIGQMSRRRGHSQQIGYISPHKDTVPLARSVCLTLKDAFNWQPPINAPSKLRYTYLIYVINQVVPLLFENRRNAYHVMLFKLYETGAHKALFDLVQPILAQMAQGKIDDGVEELLESWLGLVERLCNPGCIVDSLYVHTDIPDDKATSAALAKRYLLTAHRDAFVVVKSLWENGIKLKSTKVVEAALNVLVLILKSEKTIKESDKAEKEDRKTPEQERREMEEQVSPEMLNQLIDMGFSRQVAVQALFMGGNVETAAEWLLTQPHPALRAIVTNNQPSESAEAAVMDEEEQLQRALALSMQNGGEIGADAAVPPPPPPPPPPPAPTPAPAVPPNEPTDQAAGTDPSRMAAGGEAASKEKQPEPIEAKKEEVVEALKLADAPILDWMEVRAFADEVLVAQCFAMMDTDAKLVYRISECLSTAISAFGSQWDGTVKLLNNIIGEIISVASNCSTWLRSMTESTCAEADSLFSRLHLLCLLFEELRETCVTLLAPEQEKLIMLLSDVLYATTRHLTPTDPVPKYVTALLLWFDLHERAAVSLQRKLAHEEILGPNRIWKYWDQGWNTYQPFLKSKIETEYTKGAPTVKFEMGRNRYVLDFSTMVQTNLDTNYERNVVVLKEPKKPAPTEPAEKKESETQTEAVQQTVQQNGQTTDDCNKDKEEKMEEEPVLPTKTKSQLNMLTFEVKAKVMECCISLLGGNADCQCVQAVLRICLRLSRDNALAADFVQMRGLEALLALKRSHAFAGINNVLGLIVRHVLEDADTLKHTMEKVVRGVVQAPLPHRWGQQQTVDGHDLYATLRSLGPLACRHTQLFKQVFTTNVQFRVKPEDITGSNMVTVVPVQGPAHIAALTPALQNVLKILVNYLTRDLTPPKEDEPMDTSEGPKEGPKETKDTNETTQPSEDKKKELEKKGALIQKSAVLRLLGELVRSYSAVASFLAESRVAPSKESVIKEEMSLIGYLLDHLLILSESDKADSDCPSAVKVLMAVLASCNHSPDAQSALVVELKSALHRAMVSPESEFKHQKLCALVTLVGIIKDSCPNVHNTSTTDSQQPQTRTTSLQSNTVLRLIARKRVLLDLARVPLCLQLTSPQAVSTLNTVLKILDDLTRLINAPQVAASASASAQTIRPETQTTMASVVFPADASVVRPPDPLHPSGMNQNEAINQETNQPPAERMQQEEAAAVQQGEESSGALPSHILAVGSPADGPMAEPTANNAPSDTNTEGSGTRSMVQHMESWSLDFESLGGAEQGDSRESYDNSTSPFHNDDEDPVPIPQNNHQPDYDESGSSSGSSSESGPDAERHEDEDDDDSSVSADDHEDMGMDDVGDDGGVVAGEEVGNEAGSEHSDYDEMDDVATAEEYDDEEELSDYEEDYENYGRVPGVDGMLDGLAAEINAAVPFGRHRSRDFDADLAFAAEVVENVRVSPASNAASSHIGLTHPLLNRPAQSPHADRNATGGGGRARRTEPYAMRHGQWLFGLQRQGAVRHRHQVRIPVVGLDRQEQELSAILQRLYGPGVAGIADDILNMGRHAMPPNANRFYISEEDYMRREAAMEDYLDQEGASGRMVMVSTVPTAIQRWSEECKLLEGDSVHKLVHSIIPDIEAALDVQRQKSLEENKKKRDEAEKAKIEMAKNTVKIKRKPSDSQLATDPANSAEQSNPTADNPGHRDIDDRPRPFDAPEPTNRALPPSGAPPTMSDAAVIQMVDDFISNNPDPLAEAMDNPQDQAQAEPPPMDTTPSSTPPMDSTPTSNPSTNPGPPIDSNPTSDPASDPNPAPPMDSTPASNPAPNPAPPMDVTQSDEPTGAAPPIEQDPVSNITNASGVTVNSSDGEAPSAQESEQAPSEAGSSASAAATAGSIPDEFRELLGDMQVPEGVDPAFLAALPENMRREVIEDHLRQQRVQRLRQQQENQRNNQPEAANASGGEAPAAAAPGTAAAAPAADAGQQQPPAAEATAISPEFLDALPPDLQEEVLTQQRAAQQATRPHQDEAFDATAFLDTLAPGLRQQVLAEADDTQIQALPANLAAEARRLRSDLERRQMQRLAQGRGRGMYRVYDPAGGRHHHDFPMAYIDRVVSDRGYPRGYRMHDDAGFGQAGYAFAARVHPSQTHTVKGQQLLDREALTGLLTLFFVSDPKLNHGRLARILKSVCHHAPTRDWLIRALISIMDRLRKSINEYKTPKEKGADGGYSSSQSWLNLTVSTGLGGKAPVFSFNQKSGSKKCAVSGDDIVIHPQAASSACLHVLDTLITLAKSFPQQFVPTALRIVANTKESEEASGASSSSAGKPSDALTTDFWNILIKLDSAGPNNAIVPASTPMKSASKVSRSGSGSGRLSMCRDSGLHFPDEAAYAKLQEAPLGRILSMLDHPIVLENTNLMERTLRLLHQLLTALPDDTYERLKKSENVTDDNVILECELSLAVDVVTQRKCTNEAYYNAYHSLIECVRKLGNATQNAIKMMLLDGARRLGKELETQIAVILDQLGAIPKNSSLPGEQGVSMEEAASRGQIQDRFTGNPMVLFGASTGRRTAAAMGSCLEMQLSAMELLTANDSIQHHLLRTLNTVIKVEKEIKDRIAKQEAILKEKEEKAIAELARETAAKEAEKKEDTKEVEQKEEEKKVEETKEEPKKEEVQKADTMKAECSKTSQGGERSLSVELELDSLWIKLSDCLSRLDSASDPHAVLVLQPAAEAFFVVHAAEETNKDEGRNLSGSSGSGESQPVIQEMQMSMTESMSAISEKKDSNLVQFALKHRRVLNQILRQSQNQLMDGPFAVLIDHPRLLDFDVKREYFKKELARQNERNRLRREDKAVHVRRQDVFQDSFRELHRLSPAEWKSRFYIIFQGEEGQDAGGLLREWYAIITREIFNPNYALFKVAPGDKVTFMINPMSHINIEHLDYFKFVGHCIAKAIYDNKQLDCYFSRAFYKHILNKPVSYQDIESEDPQFFQSLEYIRKNSITGVMDLMFTTEVNEFGTVDERELKPGGKHIEVTDDNKEEYVRLTCQMKMTGAIRKQLQVFLEGFYDIIPKKLISIFNEQELELLISGLPTIDIDDLQKHTDYVKYTKGSPQIRWFWRALRSFEQADVAKFLQFVTGTSKVPLQGFGALEGMGGVQKFSIHMDNRSTDRLPSSHTCFNQLDLPAYETYEKLREQMLTAIRECTEGFGFA